MNISKHKRLVCAAAFALFFGACASSAWAVTYTSTVTSSPTGEEANAAEYIIEVDNNRAIAAEQNDITIGGDNTENITISTNNDGYDSVVAYQDHTLSLTATEDINITGGYFSIYSDYGGKITINAGGDNVITNSMDSAIASWTSDSSVVLEAGGNNVINGNSWGIYAGEGTNVELQAGGDNLLSGSNLEGYGVVGAFDGSEVELSAEGNNTIDNGDYAINAAYESTIKLTAVVGDNTAIGNVNGIYSGESTVDLNAGGSNSLAGDEAGILSAVADGSNGTSIVTLKAGVDNLLEADNSSGSYIYSYGLYSYGNGGYSEVTLEAGRNNEITGADYGVVSFDDGHGGSSYVKLIAGGKNIITATADDGAALLANYKSIIDVTGFTELSGYYGARTYNGGTIAFNSDVTIANATYAAHAYGQDSEITFNEGLSNEGYDSIIRALSGGTVTVNASGTGTVNYTGATYLDDNESSTINMNLSSDSVWHLTGDSSATALINSGLLDMTADGNGFSTLTLDTLSGDCGIIQMDIDGSTAGNSDRLLVDTHEGTHYITLNNVGENTDGAVGTVLVSVGTEQGSFEVINNETEGTIYWTRYDIDSKDSETYTDGTDLYLSYWGIANDENGQPKPTTTVSSVMSAASLNYHSWMMQNTKLLQRLSDLRQGGYSGDNGAWFRISGSKLELGGQHGFENEYIQYEAGYDKIVAQNSQFTMYGGLAITYADGESSYNRGDGDNESKAVSLYFTQINKGGSYLDVVFKLGRWENDFKVYDTYGNRITGETESTGISLSAEYGKKFVLGSRGLYIEPQAQLTYGHFDGDNYTLSNGVSVHSEGIESLVGRAGFNLGWDINPRSNIYLKANVLYEFLGDYGITMSDASGRVYKSGDYSDTWFLYGLGASFKLGKPNSGNFLHFDVERSTGGDLDQEWFYNVGFRFEM